METKTCKQCGQEKPFTAEYWQWNKSTQCKAGGYWVGTCKLCLFAKNRAWRKANAEWANAYQREWKRRNPEKVKTSEKKWRDAHPGVAVLRAKLWKEANPDRNREMNRKRRQRNAVQERECVHERRASRKSRDSKTQQPAINIYRRAFQCPPRDQDAQEK